MTNSSIRQKGTKKSINMQNNDMSQTTIVYNGMSLQDIRTIAIDVYKAEEAKKFTGDALIVAEKRVETLVMDFLGRLFSENNQLIENLKKPSVQLSLLNAEKGFVKDETGYTKNYYIELLNARIGSEDRSTTQIFEDEAIKLLEKVTNNQLNYLTFMFLLYDYPKILNDTKSIVDYCNLLVNLYDESFKKDITLISLDAVGACIPLGGARNLMSIQHFFRENIPGMFYKGQTLDDIKNIIGEENMDSVMPLLTKYVWNNNLIQVNALNLKTLKSNIRTYGLEQIESAVVDMYNKQIMSEKEIKEKLVSLNPKMEFVLSLTENSEFSSRRITPQGIILAIINYNQKYEEKLDFEKYVS